jgi:hypothetical protein
MQMEIEGDWAPVMNSVMDKIRTRFSKEYNEEELKGPANKTYR